MDRRSPGHDELPLPSKPVARTSVSVMRADHADCFTRVRGSIASAAPAVRRMTGTPHAQHLVGRRAGACLSGQVAQFAGVQLGRVESHAGEVACQFQREYAVQAGPEEQGAAQGGRGRGVVGCPPAVLGEVGLQAGVAPRVLPASASVQCTFARHTLGGADVSAALLTLVVRLGRPAGSRATVGTGRGDVRRGLRSRSASRSAPGPAPGIGRSAGSSRSSGSGRSPSSR